MTDNPVRAAAPVCSAGAVEDVDEPLSSASFADADDSSAADEGVAAGVISVSPTGEVSASLGLIVVVVADSTDVVPAGVDTADVVAATVLVAIMLDAALESSYVGVYDSSAHQNRRSYSYRSLTKVIG
jgi:hypothetical protein